jgi:4-amino-4-deoxy-L-arabinose transferase-like glycosyltransferase
MSRRTELAVVTLILLAAAGLRIAGLNDVPPGWRDDEVVETAVHAQLVLDGNFPIYFPQAEGHEPLYHYLSAALIALAGRSLFTVRLLSVFFGLIGLAALYRLARQWFGAGPARLAAAALAVSFWGLMYARFKVRHVSEVGFMLLAFYFCLTPVFKSEIGRPKPALRNLKSLTAGFGLRASPFALYAGLWLAACLYTYYAARAAPVILLAFAAYLLLFHRGIFRAQWRSFALTFALSAALAAPLAWAIANTPGGEERLRVVGRPLFDLLRGDVAGAWYNTTTTLRLFAFTGDPEYLYNIPRRPVFEALGAALFLAGVTVSLWRWRQPRHAFLLLWLMGGLAPAFASVPAASLGHTIAAQPVMYLLPAVGLSAVGEGLRRVHPNAARGALGIGAILFLGVTAARDLPDYFVRWPALPEVRYLYRADLHAAAAHLNAHPPASPDIALTSRLLSQADVTALRLETPGLDLQPRLFQPDHVWMFPSQPRLAVIVHAAPGSGEFGLAPFDSPFLLRQTDAIPNPRPAVPLVGAFANGWTCLGYTLDWPPGSTTVRVYAYWRVEAAFTPPPPRPLAVLSRVPFTIKFFSHVLYPDGAYLAGDDRLDLDPATLRPGDDFIHLFAIPLPPGLAPGQYPLEIGIYDPVSGERARLASGDDHLTLTTLTLAP